MDKFRITLIKEATEIYGAVYLNNKNRKDMFVRNIHLLDYDNNLTKNQNINISIEYIKCIVRRLSLNEPEINEIEIKEQLNLLYK